MKQTRFEWQGERELAEPIDVVLDPETTEELIVLMASAMIAVVRAVEEDAHER